MYNNTLPTEWRWANLGDLAADFDGAISIGPFGSRMKAETYTETGVRVIRGVNISDTRSLDNEWVHVPRSFAITMPKCIVKPGDLVFPHRGAIGEVGIVPEDNFEYMISTSLMKITLDTRKTTPKYVFYYFRSNLGKTEILRFSSQVGTPGIGQPLTSLKKFAIPLPPLEQQYSIIRILGMLDDKIDLNRRTNETLEAMARALFKSWFVDFDPVHAKAAGKAPAHMDADTAALFPDAFGEDGLPVGWFLSNLASLIDVNPKEKLKKSVVAPYVDMAALPTKGFSINATIGRPFSSGSRFRNGDTLLARITPCLENGKTGYVDNLADGQVGWGSTEFIVLRPRAPIPSSFGYLLAREETFRAYAIRSMTGTSGRQRVQTSSLNEYPIVQAPRSVFSAFGALIAPWFEMIRANHAENQTLTNLRDLLLPKLMSGEIRLREAEELAAGAA